MKKKAPTKKFVRKRVITKADVAEGMLRYPLNLTDHLRKALTLRYLEGWSKAAVSRAIGYSPRMTTRTLELGLVRIGVLTARWTHPDAKCVMHKESVYRLGYYKRENST